MASSSCLKVADYFIFISFTLCFANEVSGLPTINVSPNQFAHSISNAQQHQARRNCAVQGKQLAIIKTADQVNELADYLSEYGKEQEGFWVDAWYDPVEKKFHWQDSSDPVEFTIENHQIEFEQHLSDLNQQTGLQVKYRGEKIWYKSADMNQNQNYICQKIPKKIEKCNCNNYTVR